MKYKGFEFTLDFVDTICSKDSNGNRKFICGFFCRIFDAKDLMHEKVLDEFYLTSNTVGEPYWEVRETMSYIDKHFIELVQRSHRIDSERAQTILTNICNYLYDTLNEDQVEQLCKNAEFSVDEFKNIASFHRTYRRYNLKESNANDY